MTRSFPTRRSSVLVSLPQPAPPALAGRPRFRALARRHGGRDAGRAFRSARRTTDPLGPDVRAAGADVPLQLRSRRSSFVRARGRGDPVLYGVYRMTVTRSIRTKRSPLAALPKSGRAAWRGRVCTY